MTIGLIIRGHERDVFDNSRLYDFVKRFTSEFDVDIYIHSWTKSRGLSWRGNDGIIAKEMNEESIINYFKDIPIKKLIIDDEENIALVGRNEGLVCKGPCPRLAWKRMWYGKFQIIKYIKEQTVFYDFIVNTRFDIFQNSNNIFTEETIIAKTKKLLDFKTINHIYFLEERPVSGIDNCYFGNQTVMFLLTELFNNNLQSVEELYPNNFYTEFLVYFESLKLNYKVWLSLIQQTPEVNSIRIQ